MSEVNCFTGIEPPNQTSLCHWCIKLFDVRVFCYLLGVVVATGLVLLDPEGVVEYLQG